ncbi:MAG: hypothetical protein AAGH99_07960 [Planctomycetota bacterium]
MRYSRGVDRKLHQTTKPPNHQTTKPPNHQTTKPLIWELNAMARKNITCRKVDAPPPSQTTSFKLRTRGGFLQDGVVKSLKDAIYIAQMYTLEIEYDDQSACYLGHALELPAVYGRGDTEEVCDKSLRSAIADALLNMLKRRSKIPAPGEISGTVREATLTHRTHKMYKDRLAEFAKRDNVKVSRLLEEAIQEKILQLESA